MLDREGFLRTLEETLGFTPKVDFNAGVVAAGGYGTGAEGNLCHVDCANRGKCDFRTGLCECWTGSYGQDCSQQSVLAK